MILELIEFTSNANHPVTLYDKNDFDEEIKLRIIGGEGTPSYSSGTPPYHRSLVEESSSAVDRGSVPAE